jgi:plastocyanin
MRRSLLVGIFVGILALGSLLLASAPAVAGGGGCTEVTSGHSAAVDLKGLCIFPTLVRVPSGGGEVTFTNYDDTNHVVVGAGSAWGSDGIMHQGDSFTARFTRDGVYPFQCYLHPGMSGAVLVGDANARGAATSGSVTVPVPSDAAVTPAIVQPPIVQPAEPRTSGRTNWWLLATGGLVLASAAAFAMWRLKIRSSNASTSTPAEA